MRDPQRSVVRVYSRRRSIRYLPTIIFPQLEPTPNENAAKDLLWKQKELYWKQYQLLINVYERLLELTLKTDALYYVATGAILSFYEIHKPTNGTPSSMVYVLLFPVLVSLLLIPLFGFGAYLLRDYRAYLNRLAAELDVEAVTEFNVLAALLASSAFLFLVVAASLLYYFYYIIDEYYINDKTGYHYLKHAWLIALLIEAVVCFFSWLLFRTSKSKNLMQDRLSLSLPKTFHP